MLKHIKTAAVILCFGFAFLLFGCYITLQQTYKMTRGNYFFTATRDNTDIKSVVLTFPDNKTITIKETDNLWRIKEADDYFASLSKVNNLVALIRSTLVYRSDEPAADKLNTSFEQNLKIETIDKNGIIIDSAVIAPKAQNNKHHYATLNQNNLIYQITGNFNLSSHIADWVDSPILALDASQIKSISFDNIDVFRVSSYDDFKSVSTGESVPQIKALVTNFRYLTALGVKHAVHFNADSAQKARQYTFVLFNGLVYYLDIYKNNDTYWLNVRLDRQGLADARIPKFINDNAILYDGWFFEINPSTGQMIAEFVL